MARASEAFGEKVTRRLGPLAKRWIKEFDHSPK